MAEFPTLGGKAGAVKLTNDGNDYVVPMVTGGFVKDMFYGSSSITKNYPSPMSGFGIIHMGPEGSADITFTLAGLTGSLKAGYTYEGVFEPYNTLSITASQPFFCEVRGYAPTGPPAPADTTAPGNVASVSTSNLTHNSVTLSWPTASDNVAVTGYDIYKDNVFVTTVNSLTYNATGLPPSADVAFSVRARDAAGNVASGTSVTVTTNAAPAVSIPATPGTPTAIPADSQVSITWAAVSGAASYKVYRGGTLLASPTTNSYTDTTAVNGTAYSYTVSAVNSAGESAQSTAASATPVAAVSVPAIPTGLTATAGNAKVDLVWNAVTGASSYKVYRDGTNIASPTTASYSDATTVNGTAYSYTVSAVNSAGESTQSAAQSATPAAPTFANEIYASFDGADNTLLPNTDTGQTWTQHNDVKYGIRNNRAYQSQQIAGGVPRYRKIPYVTVPSNDFEVQVAVVTLDTTNASESVHIRWSTHLDTVFVFKSANKWNIAKIIASTYTLLKAGTKTTVSGDVLRIENKPDGTINLYVNGVLDATVTDTSLLSTSHKVGFGSDTAVSEFDDFRARY